MKKTGIIFVLTFLISGCATRVVTIREPIYIPIPSNEEKMRENSSNEARPQGERKPVEERHSWNQYVSEPPSVLKIWIYVFKGRVYQHRLFPISYPGKIRKLGMRNTTGGVVVTFVSEYNPEIRWNLCLPREDGEYNCEAYLVRQERRKE